MPKKRRNSTSEWHHFAHLWSIKLSLGWPESKLKATARNRGDSRVCNLSWMLTSRAMKMSRFISNNWKKSTLRTFLAWQPSCLRRSSKLTMKWARSPKLRSWSTVNSLSSQSSFALLSCSSSFMMFMGFNAVKLRSWLSSRLLTSGESWAFSSKFILTCLAALVHTLGKLSSGLFLS